MSDLKPVNDEEFVRASEPADNEGRAPSPVDASGQPISQAAAHEYFHSLIGIGRPMVFTRAASRCWDRLADASSTPEERLGCERMIRAAYMALGMSRWIEAKEIERNNRERQAARREAEGAERALKRWQRIQVF